MLVLQMQGKQNVDVTDRLAHQVCNVALRRTFLQHVATLKILVLQSILDIKIGLLIIRRRQTLMQVSKTSAFSFALFAVVQSSLQLGVVNAFT